MPTPLEAVRLALDPPKSMAAVAKEASLTQPTIWYWETGRRIPKPETAARLAPLYGLDPDEFREYCITAQRLLKKKSTRVS